MRCAALTGACLAKAATVSRYDESRDLDALVALELPTHVVDRKETKQALDGDVAASLSTFGQHSGDYISRVKQDCSVLLFRELDEAQSSEQENSFDGQQSMTNILSVTRFGQERIEQRAVIAPRWLHHIGGVYQGG